MSLKLLANSFYGYLGFYGARWYSFESAQTVAAWARYYITTVIREANERGFKVIYSDTDSIFIEIQNKSLESVKEFVKDQNKNFPGLIELEFEDLYPSGLFVALKASEAGAKKRYALLEQDGDIIIKGFEVVRRNYSAIGKEVQKKVLQIILKEGNPQKAVDYVKSVIADLRDKKVPLEKVIIKVQITKELEDYEAVGPHVAVAAKLRKKGFSIGAGSLISFIVAEGSGKIRDRAKTIDEVKDKEYDSEYYIENQVIPSVSKILEVFGFNADEFAKKSDQQKLTNF
jgi:DNA polymerase I